MKSTGERCYYPNVRLITLPVINLTRSCARSEKVVISLDVGQASNAAREALLVSHHSISRGTSMPSTHTTMSRALGKKMGSVAAATCLSTLKAAHWLFPAHSPASQAS